MWKNKIIFQMINPKNGRNDICVIENHNIKTIISSDVSEVDPFGFGKYIVYSKPKDGYYRITLYNTENNKEIPLTSNISDDTFYPSAYNNIILFSLYYKNGSQIFLQSDSLNCFILSLFLILFFLLLIIFFQHLSKISYYRLFLLYR